MTKVRPNRTPEDAIDRAVGILGRAEAAEAIDKEPSTLRAYGDPDSEKHISVKDALKLDLLCIAQAGEAPFTSMMRLTVEALDFRGRLDVTDALLDLHTAAGRFSEAVRVAKSPQSPGGKALTQQERKKILSVGDMILTQVQQVMAAVADQRADKEAA
jgi:hypothetical protein